MIGFLVCGLLVGVLAHALDPGWRHLTLVESASSASSGR